MPKSRALTAAGAALCVFGWSSPAAAQATGTFNPTASRWEVEGYGGLSLGRTGAGGAATFPDPGAPITTSNPTFPSRQVPSWFFGDGASLLNGVLEQLDLPERLSPLDAAIASPARNAGRSAAFGLRVRRSITPRLSAEFSVDALAGFSSLSAGVLSSADAARTSFQSAMTALLSSGPFTGVSVEADSGTTAGSSRELAATGSVHLSLGRVRSFTPYVTLGAGILRQSGMPPTVFVHGSYQGTLPGGIVIRESDQVTVRYTSDPRVVAVLGAGVSRALGGRLGVRLDGRVLLGPNGTRTKVDATPEVVTSTPAGFVETLTFPSVQFSNNASTGRVSTLSAPALQGVEVFVGSGLQLRVLVTAGVFLRF